jgi:hypothetical protein
MNEMPTAQTTPDKPRQKEAAKARRGGSSTIKKTTDLSEQVLEELQTGQRNAIAAVRKFMDSTDDVMPSLSDGRSRPQEIVDSALEMSERLVQVQYDFVRNVAHSAGEALSGSGEKK